MTDNPRIEAVRALVKIHRSAQTLDQALPPDTKPLVRELVSGTLRFHFSLSQRIDELLTRKLRSKDGDVRALLMVGAYQLLHTRIPDHAAVAETVACTKALKKPWAKGLVNAVLRNLPPPTEEWAPAAVHDHPHWFINKLRNSLPDNWLDVLTANNTRAPMTLRVNCARTTVPAYRELLEQANIDYTQGPLAETLTLTTPRPQKKLPGFDAGLVAVQDAAAQLAVEVAAPQAGMRVMDACAAPGGKGFHVLERAPGVELHMQDIAPARVATLQEQARRLQHVPATGQDRATIQITEADSTLEPAAEPALYDLILLDAPCSGSGTVRRHPDIKVLRDAHDLDALNRTQSRLLGALWQQLADNGRLIYSTCSLFTEENDAIIRRFLAQHSNATATQLSGRLPEHSATPGLATEFGWQTLPVTDGGDGLYYSELQKLN